MPRCVDCGVTCVVSSTYAGSAYKCKKCLKKCKTKTIKCHVCLKKNAPVSSKWRDDYNLATNCDECEFKDRIKCDGCGITAIVRTGSRFCPGCKDVRKKIFSEIADSTLFHEDRRVKVKCRAVETTHSGYCSDPGEYETSNTMVTYIYPCLKFKSSDMNGDEIVSDRLIELYTPSYNSYGNGYCRGCGVEYVVIKATVIDTFKWDGDD